MRNMLLAVLFALFMPANAMAQGTPTPTSPQGPQTAAPTIRLNMEDQHVLKENLLKAKGNVGSAPNDLGPGKRLPESVQLRDFPADIASKIPQIKAHKYAIVGDAILIVEPQERKVVEVVK
jgi:hypothetical protein